MKPTDFISGKVTYDKDGQYFWINKHDGGIQMLAELRGWGAIQNMFVKTDKTINIKAAAEFQDKLGDFIAQAINEKIEREREKKPKTYCEKCKNTGEIRTKDGIHICFH